MDKKIKTLFEYQKFAQNKRLGEILNAQKTQLEPVTELSDDQLYAVAGGKKLEDVPNNPDLKTQ